MRFWDNYRKDRLEHSDILRIAHCLSGRAAQIGICWLLE